MKTITITDPTQIEEIIRKCPYCIVGITDLEGNPYAVPMNFAYQDGVIYLHSGPEGSKVEMVTKHPQVCITFCEGHELVYMWYRALNKIGVRGERPELKHLSRGRKRHQPRFRK